MKHLMNKNGQYNKHVQMLIDGLNSEYYETYIGLFNGAINRYLDYEDNSDLYWVLDDSGYYFKNYWEETIDYEDLRDYYLEELTYVESDYGTAICSAINNIKDELIELNEPNDCHDTANDDLEKLSDSEFEALLEKQLRDYKEAREYIKNL